MKFGKSLFSVNVTKSESWKDAFVRKSIGTTTMAGYGIFVVNYSE